MGFCTVPTRHLHNLVIFQFFPSNEANFEKPITKSSFNSRKFVLEMFEGLSKLLVGSSTTAAAEKAASTASSVAASATSIVADIPKRYTQYTLEELNELSILQRLQLHDWTLEMLTFGFTIVFVILFKFGDYYNHSIVTKFLKGVDQVFTGNFYQFGTSSNELYIKDSAENYSSYATGRANIDKVNITFKLKPRHNIFVFCLETIMSYFTESVLAPTDRVDIEIFPSNNASYDNFIQAVVSKIGMNDYRKFNYFLSLTKTSDSPLIPESFVVMTEVNEIQEKVITPDLRDSLTLDAANYLRFISFTDQPSDRPESLRDLLPRRRIIISTHLVTGDSQLQQLSKILQSIFDTVDKLSAREITFKNETLRKIVKTREVEVNKIQKLIDAAKEEELAEEKAKLKQQEKDKFRSLSRDEQIKLEKKANEKKQRKLQKKQRVKV